MLTRYKTSCHYSYEELAVQRAVVMTVAILLDNKHRSLYVNRRFGGMYHLHLQCRKSTKQETNVQQLGRCLARLVDFRP
jgi:hypothetical protein